MILVVFKLLGLSNSTFDEKREILNLKIFQEEKPKVNKEGSRNIPSFFTVIYVCSVIHAVGSNGNML